MQKLLKIFGFAASTLATHTAFGMCSGADYPPGVPIEQIVSERYTVGFNPPSVGELPFTARGDIAALEAALNLDGEILCVWQSTNALYVKVSAAEAERLRALPSVNYVQQDSILTLDDEGQVTAPPPGSGNGRAELAFRTPGNEHFLRVPLVDTGEAPGQYQDAIFRTTIPGDASKWELLFVEQGTPLPLDSVELVVTDETPAQVFLRIEGALGACRKVGKIAVSTYGNDFSVFAYFDRLSLQQVCPAVIATGYTKSIPLPVYGLEAGTYTYSVNGGNAGEFTLEEDNVFSEDGEVSNLVPGGAVSPIKQ